MQCTLTSSKPGILQEAAVWRNTNITPCPKTPDFPCWVTYVTWYKTAGCNISQILHLQLLPNSHRKEDHDSTGSKRPVTDSTAGNVPA